MNNYPEQIRESSIAAHLEEAMRVKGVSIEKLAQMTGISERFVELIVGNKADKLPSAPYMHGYLVKIGEVLGIDGEALWREHLSHNIAVPRSGAQDRFPGTERFPIPFGRKTVIGISIGAIILLYIAFRIPSLLGKPKLSVSFDDNTVVATSTFSVSGTTDTENSLTVNGEPVYPDTTGAFTKSVTLNPGFNTFTIVAKRLLGAENSIVRQVFFKTPSTTTPTHREAPQEPGSATGTETLQ